MGRLNEYTGGGNSSTRNISVQDYEKQMRKEYEDQKKEIEKLQAELKIQKTENMKYKIFNVKDLLSEIQYQGVRKGTKTELYLEDVINSINTSGKYKWVQFFQLVDVFYVVVSLDSNSKSKNASEEIRDHYKKVQPTEISVESVVADVETAANKAGESISKLVSLKTSIPWKK